MDKLVMDAVGFIAKDTAALKTIGYSKTEAEESRRWCISNFLAVVAMVKYLLHTLTDYWLQHKEKSKGTDLYLNTLVLQEVEKVTKDHKKFVYAVVIQVFCLLSLPYTLVPLTSEDDKLSDAAMLTDRGKTNG